jgi:hypothetical protein
MKSVASRRVGAHCRAPTATRHGGPRFPVLGTIVKQAIVFLACRHLLPAVVAYWLIQLLRLRDA